MVTWARCLYKEMILKSFSQDEAFKVALKELKEQGKAEVPSHPKICKNGKLFYPISEATLDLGQQGTSCALSVNTISVSSSVALREQVSKTILVE